MLLLLMVQNYRAQKWKFSSTTLKITHTKNLYCTFQQLLSIHLSLGPPGLLLNGDQGPFHWQQSGWGVKLASHLNLTLGVRNAHSYAYNFMAFMTSIRENKY